MFHLFIYHFFYSDEEFGPNLSSHSWRKRGSNNTRKAGATRDEKDHRGRWKGKKRVSDCYDNVELPWPDVKMAGLLCPGGPCKYVIDKDVTMFKCVSFLSTSLTNFIIILYIITELIPR